MLYNKGFLGGSNSKESACNTIQYILVAGLAYT